MSAHCILRSHPPLKTVLNKVGDSYQTYINTYKYPIQWLLTMEAQDNPWDRDTTPYEQGTDILSDYHHEDMDNFGNVEHENHTTLKGLARDLDDL